MVGRMRVIKYPPNLQLRMCYLKMKICEVKIWTKTARMDWTARLGTRGMEGFR